MILDIPIFRPAPETCKGIFYQYTASRALQHSSIILHTRAVRLYGQGCIGCADCWAIEAHLAATIDHLKVDRRAVSGDTLQARRDGAIIVLDKA